MPSQDQLGLQQGTVGKLLHGLKAWLAAAAPLLTIKEWVVLQPPRPLAPPDCLCLLGVRANCAARPLGKHKTPSLQR